MGKKARIELLYEDEDLVVVNKPPGVLSIPDRFRSEQLNVRQWLMERRGRVYIVHRLDRDTSGVMVVAKTAEAHRALCLQFEYRRVRKRYHAVLAGVLEQEELQIDFPLLPDPRRPGRMIPSARGREALTSARVLERFAVATYVECQTSTGRLHQIRVHCAAIGHPLLVDPEYGAVEGFLLSSIKPRYKRAPDEPEPPLMGRVPLHALALAFEHPRTGEWVEFQAPLPKDLRALLHALRKYAPYTQPWYGLQRRAIPEVPSTADNSPRLPHP